MSVTITWLQRTLLDSDGLVILLHQDTLSETRMDRHSKSNSKETLVARTFKVSLSDQMVTTSKLKLSLLLLLDRTTSKEDLLPSDAPTDKERYATSLKRCKLLSTMMDAN